MTPQQRAAAALAAAVSIAVPAEGLRHYAYRDPPGVLTACRGHTGPDVRDGVYYPLAQCDAWLTADMRRALAQVESCAPGLPWQVLAAFGDAVFNLGPRIVCDTRPAPDGSTAARLLAAGDVEAACRQLPRWDKASLPMLGMVSLPGLTKRRAAEMHLCLQAFDAAPPSLGVVG